MTVTTWVDLGADPKPWFLLTYCMFSWVPDPGRQKLFDEPVSFDGVQSASLHCWWAFEDYLEDYIR